MIRGRPPASFREGPICISKPAPALVRAERPMFPMALLACRAAECRAFLAGWRHLSERILRESHRCVIGNGRKNEDRENASRATQIAQVRQQIQSGNGGDNLRGRSILLSARRPLLNSTSLRTRSAKNHIQQVKLTTSVSTEHRRIRSLRQPSLGRLGAHRPHFPSLG